MIMIPDPLAIAWYWVIGALLLVYALLDGIDLGAAFWFLSAPRTSGSRYFRFPGLSGMAMFSGFWPPPAHSSPHFHRFSRRCWVVSSRWQRWWYRV